MPIQNFEGKTFVAFIDISGFKELMKDEKRAWRALNRFYQHGYDVIRDRQTNFPIEGIFVSDSGILFARNCNDKIESLKALLEAVRKLNRKMLGDDYILTTSIAYGNFKYQERIEFVGIEKNPIYGDAYVSAFLDNENGKPRIQPGQRRIIRENLPPNLIQFIEDNNNDEILRMIKRRNSDENHYYFYWMVEDPQQTEQFEKEYSDAYNLKYTGMLKALKMRRNVRHF